MRLRAIAVVPASAAAIALAVAAPAQALTCAQFKTAVESAADGATVTLDAGAHCHDSYNLPSGLSHFSVTIQGAGAGATLDGSTNPGQGILNGYPTAGSQIHATVRNLTFTGGSAPVGFGGGAIALDGGDVAAAIDHARFVGNSAGGGIASAGAVVARAQAGAGPIQITNSTFGDGTLAGANTGGVGGAVYAAVAGNGGSIAMSGNVFRGNRATDGGGGAFVAATGAAAAATLTGNSFVGNTAGLGGGGLRAGGTRFVAQGNSFVGNIVDVLSDARGAGGGLQVSGGGSAVQIGNRFDGNRVVHHAQANFSALGGAEYSDTPVTIRRDRFTHNSLAAPTGTGESEGGAMALIGCGSNVTMPARLEGVVAAANKAAQAEGAGVYAGGCTVGPVALTVLDSTIAGNAATGPGAVAGLAGGGADRLTLRNSIVASNAGGSSLAGFGAGRSVSHSDVCAPAKLAGVGNLCAPPQLVDPFHANVHLKATSPAISAGAGAEVPQSLGRDVDGDKRTLGVRVDMGADEFRLADDPFHGMKLAKQTDPVSHGTARVKVRCPKTVAGPCKGTLTLRADGDVLGKAKFSIASGKLARVPVKLNKRAKAALADAGGALDATARSNALDRAGLRRKSKADVTLSKS